MNTANEAMKNYIEQTNTHDFTNVKKCLHNDAYFIFTDSVCSNFIELETYFNDTWNTIKDEVYKIENLSWIVNEKDSAVCVYDFKYSGYINNEYKEGTGKGTNVFLKKENDWLLIHEHLHSL
ncbi:nuclear transport factor 2 family protein [Mammaliicoccus sciuri]|uniref:nuclear transport factor 2 family protein n=1 Tax=Mammaliicoccus sciuri TaxID=1296 RepID=UPI0020C06899|nr:nuclear transport factor 2 family protein [Mammaliicoccus sciuri]